ncbi:MAG TPA: DNA replication and repair protein RecF [Patescibacteria group bacterium]
MFKALVLQHFRSYTQKKFEFHPELTVIVGKNTAGKTNLVESVLFLSNGKSFRADKDFQMIQFGQEVGRVQGLVEVNAEKTKLEIVLAQQEAAGGRFVKKYLVNDIARTRHHFVGNLPAVLFRPEELDIIVDGPSMRREFLNSVLESIDGEYRMAKTIYDKALRQRNALLYVTRETGKRNLAQFEYWDELLITNGQKITKKRNEFIEFINASKKDVFDCVVVYDKSTISEERLLQYKDQEVSAAVTLVGPQRDDFYVTMKTKGGEQNVQHFGSRGQQRLVILQLKLLHILFVEQKLSLKPLLVLDDIFSELDNNHIQLVLDKTQENQTILTTTHKEFIDSHKMKDFAIIEL